MMDYSQARPLVDDTPSDITTLYTRFGQASAAGTYQEIVRDQSAMHAALRWPLLAEMQGVATTTSTPSYAAEDTASADLQP